MYRPVATLDRPNNTQQWRVMFTMADTILITNKDEAQDVVDLVNTAYDRGRSDLQRELRGLLNTPKAEE